jgi:hypothetical protein
MGWGRRGRRREGREEQGNGRNGNSGGSMRHGLWGMDAPGLVNRFGTEALSVTMELYSLQPLCWSSNILDDELNRFRLHGFLVNSQESIMLLT